MVVQPEAADKRQDMRRHLLPTLVIPTLFITASLAGGCAFERSSTPLSPTPSPTAGPSFVGLWASQTATPVASPSTGGNLQWTISSQTTTTVSGTFSALCAGGV